MAEPLKNKLNKKFISKIAASIKENDRNFAELDFVQTTMAKDWSDLELKQRLTRICETLEKKLPKDYQKSIEILMAAAPNFSGFEAMFFPEFVWRYGRNKKYWKLSQKALIHFTQYSSSEFAVRPFIEDNLTQVMKWMLELSLHKNYHVRRLASEGCRPRLPWAPALIELKKDPNLILPILNNLKDDPELYVRRSVANNINDITKDNPRVALQLANRWLKQGASENTQWIIKHGLRSLVKKGDQQALAILGYSKSKNLSADNFKIERKKLRLGNSLEFTFEIHNRSQKDQKCMVDFVIDHLKKNGQYQAKVFKLKSLIVPKNSVVTLKKSHSFKEINTRTYYPGKHFLSLQLNGQAGEKLSFILLN